MIKIFWTIFILFSLIICNSCNGNRSSSIVLQMDSTIIQKHQTGIIQISPKDTIDILLDPILADGFDFPVGNTEGRGEYISKINNKTYGGWYISIATGEFYDLGIHTGEDWNGVGGNNTDLGQKVYSIANGIVIEASDFYPPWGNVIMIEHLFLENANLKTVYSLYAHLDTMYIKTGDTLHKRQLIGTIGNAENSFPAHLHFEIRKSEMKGYAIDYWPSSNNKDKEWVLNHYEKPSDFINTHRNLTQPNSETQILIALKSKYKMYLINNGQVKHIYEIALSQDPAGHKVRQGDNKLPEGEYAIIQKLKGPISGTWGDYFGTAWIRINYPNNYDAENGYETGLIGKSDMDKIITANNNKQ